MYNSNDGQKVLPWDQRINQVYWRGHSTGCWHQINTWRESHRVRLHLLANTNRTTDGDRVDDEVDVLFEDEEQREEEDGQGGFGGQSVFGRSSWLRKKKHEKGRGLRRKTISRTEFNEAFMDVGLIGPALVCDSKDGTCEEMNANLEYLDPIHKGSKGEGHKYTVDVGESTFLLVTEEVFVIDWRLRRWEWLVWSLPRAGGQRQRGLQVDDVPGMDDRENGPLLSLCRTSALIPYALPVHPFF